jgi:hypothetical protein
MPNPHAVPQYSLLHRSALCPVHTLSHSQFSTQSDLLLTLIQSMERKYWNPTFMIPSLYTLPGLPQSHHCRYIHWFIGDKWESFTVLQHKFSQPPSPAPLAISCATRKIHFGNEKSKRTSVIIGHSYFRLWMSEISLHKSCPSCHLDHCAYSVYVAVLTDPTFTCLAVQLNTALLPTTHKMFILQFLPIPHSPVSLYNWTPHCYQQHT